MAIEISMPQLSDTMDEGTILSWHKSVGDSVERGDALAEVSTDKADLEIESFHEGTLLKIYAQTGETIKVGAIIAVIGEDGEEVPDSQPAGEKKSSELPNESTTPEPEVTTSTTPTETAVVNGNGGQRIKASPLAKNIAQSKGIDLATIKGTGEGGRITKKDLDSVVPSVSSSKESLQKESPVPKAPVSIAPGSKEPLSKMRKTIADRMVQSATSTPHFYVTTSIEVTKLLEMRASIKELLQYEGITINHLIIKGAGLALRQVPRINASYVDDTLVQPQDINIGVITAVEDGLLIPVIKQADRLSLSDIVTDVRALVQRARGGRPKADDLVGGTFSISNVGRSAVEHFTAIINPGQGAILAVSAISEEPVILDGKIASGKVIRLTLSVDHRIIDGIVAGAFLTEMKRLLEDPVLLLA